METDVYIRSSRRKHNQIRLLEKQIRPEIIERCLQFIDVVIHQIIYQENIYPSNLFVPRQMYRLIVHQCIDKDISSYITLCVASLRDLFSNQLSDMISINILRNSQIPIILRRYLVEIHTINDPCLRAIYDNSKQLINQLDQAFAHCINKIKQIKQLENYKFNKRWAFQLRSNLNENNEKSTTIEDLFRKQPIYREFLLINQQSNLLSNGKQSIISSIKSLHTERVKLQFMCEDDKYEQEQFLQLNQSLINNTSNDQQDTDYETDFNINDSQKYIQQLNMYSSANKELNEPEIWPLTTSDSSLILTIDQQQSPCSADIIWQEEELEDDEEDF